MKRSVLSVAFIATAIGAFCQSKPDSAKQYPGPLPANPVTISITFPASVWGDYTVFEYYGLDNLRHSQQISAAQATQVIENHQRVADSLKIRIGRYIQEDKEKWTADTAKRNKVKLKKQDLSIK